MAKDFGFTEGTAKRILAAVRYFERLGVDLTGKRQGLLPLPPSVGGGSNIFSVLLTGPYTGEGWYTAKSVAAPTTSFDPTHGITSAIFGSFQPDDDWLIGNPKEISDAAPGWRLWDSSNVFNDYWYVEQRGTFTDGDAKVWKLGAIISGIYTSCD